MSVPIEIDRLEYRRVAAPIAKDKQSAKAKQFWDVVDPTTNTSIAHAEIYTLSPSGAAPPDPGPSDEWGVRLFDRAPSLDESDLTRVVAKLLVWHANCTAETVELWLVRTNARSVMVRVLGDYV